MPTKISFIVTPTSLEPVFPTMPELKLEKVKDAKINGSAITDAQLTKATELFKAMNPEPQNDNAKPMDLLNVKKVDANTYTVIIAQTMTVPKDVEMPEELKDFVKDGFSLTAYQKMKFELTSEGLKLTPYEMFKAGSSTQPSTDDMTKMFKLSEVEKLGEDNLAQGGMTFKAEK